MMETKRTKLWRKKKAFRVFKARLMYYAAAMEYCVFRDPDGSPHTPLHWFELAKAHHMQVFRTTGTPCSCDMCRLPVYDRTEYKRETRRILRETLED